MKLGMVLLFFMALFSISGTVLPQGNSLQFYENGYSPMVYRLIVWFHLDRVYTSWWFLLFVGLLAFNLLFCSLRRLPELLRTMGRTANLSEVRARSMVFEEEVPEDFDFKTFFKAAGFSRVEEIRTPSGIHYRGMKHRLGTLGSWFSHLGLLLIIVFYALGKATGYEAMLYGVPGTDHALLDTGYRITIEDFDIQYRQDHSVHQYITDLRVYQVDGTYEKTGQTMVNRPFRAKDFNVYQNGTGWAMEVSLTKEEEPFAMRMLHQSEVFVEDGQRIALQFLDYYPDFVLHEGRPYTLSPFPRNPRYLYALFYEGQRVRMNVASPGEAVSYGEYTFTAGFPQLFTVVQVVRDPGTFPVAVGGALLLFGIFLSFYWVPQELHGWQGAQEAFLAGHTRKNGAIFKERLKEIHDRQRTEG